MAVKFVGKDTCSRRFAKLGLLPSPRAYSGPGREDEGFKDKSKDHASALILGFGGTIGEDRDPEVLAVFAAGIIVAVLSRGRREKWTMPEFEAVDLTSRSLPPSILNRVKKLNDLDYLGDLHTVSEQQSKTGGGREQNGDG